VSRVLIIAPHPDDEILGVGGTMARLAAEGNEVYSAIVTKAREPMFSRELIETGRAEAVRADKILGVKKTIFPDIFPAALLDTLPHSEVNAGIRKLIAEVDPEILFVPFYGDLHIDHRLIFESALVACRPNGQKIPSRIYAYETLSETNWNAPGLTPAFAPNVFVDISDFLELKLQALEIFASQMQPFPNERSIEAIKALAIHRGATVNRRAAEAFVLIRNISDSGAVL